MSKQISGRSPSQEEYLQAIESEFAFLVEDGYSREITGDYDVDFVKAPYRLRIIGASYGFAIEIDFTIDGKYCPFWSLLPKDKTRKTPRTDVPQLDQIRESAWWLKNELRGLFRGEPEFIEKTQALLAEQKRQEESIKRNRLADKQGMFFSQADKLFKAKQFAECVRHLESREHPLSSVWKARLEYAKKHSR
jgi:hypothetical protein